MIGSGSTSRPHVLELRDCCCLSNAMLCHVAKHCCTQLDAHGPGKPDRRHARASLESSDIQQSLRKLCMYAKSFHPLKQAYCLKQANMQANYPAHPFSLIDSENYLSKLSAFDASSVCLDLRSGQVK